MSNQIAILIPFVTAAIGFIIPAISDYSMGGRLGGAISGFLMGVIWVFVSIRFLGLPYE